MVNDNHRPVDFSETIDKDKLVSEMILLRLRTPGGLNEDVFRMKTGEIFIPVKEIKYWMNYSR